MLNHSSQSALPRSIRGLAIITSLALVLALLATAGEPVSAASQNELVIGIDFDGQSFTGDDPLDPGTGITPAHTAGDDERDDNGVVRTFDLVGYRLDYNVNEEGQTGAVITVQVPANMTYITPAATVTLANPNGMFSGCLAGSTITSSGTVAPYGVIGTNDILTCVVDDEDSQGNNGTIYPIAQLLKDIDGQPKTVTGSLDTTEQPCAADPLCSGSVTVISSGAPTANFKKGEDVLDQDKNVIGREPNEFYPFEKDGVDGWISVYNIEFRTAGNSIIGSEPIDDTYPINFYDHFWDSTAGTILATSDGTLAGASLIPGRTACGEYDGGGALPTGAATWNCTQLSPTSIEFDLTGYDTDAFVPNADASPNTSVYAAAQVAFWSPHTELLAKDSMQNINTISQSATAPSGVNVADPILFGGTVGPVAESTVLDNDASAVYALTISSPGPRSLNSWVRLMNGPFAAREYENIAVGKTMFSVDERDSSVGGIGGYNEINTCRNNGTTFTITSQREGWCGQQETPRGKVLTINAAVSGRLTGVTSQFDPIHSCLAIDNTHMSLIALPSVFDVSIVEGIDPRNGNLKPPSNGRIRAVTSDEAATIGGYTGSPNQGPLAHTFSGLRSANQYHWSADGWATSNDIPSSSIVVEFASSLNPFVQVDTPAVVTTPVAVGQHELTCNNDDANPADGWVASTGDLSVFDSNNDGLYEGIDLVRVRMIDNYDWLIPDGESGSGSIGMEVNLQAQVHQDPAVDAAGQEIFVFSSRSYGEWDVATQNQPPAADCLSTESSFGPAADRLTPEGWCGLPYTEDSNLSPNAAGGSLFLDTNAIEYVNSSGSRGASHVDKIFIVEADIAVKKSNLAGLTDIKGNGEIVTYGINVSTVGATTDLLSDLTLTDNLPAGYAFVRFTQLPTTPGATCTPGDPFVCDFGDQVGGWSDYVEVEVMVQNTEADTKVTNKATLTADRNGTGLSKSSSAFSRTPGAFDEAAIIKTVNTIEGDCVAYPEAAIDVPLDPEPADWADRCEMTDYDTGQLLFDLELSNEGNLTQTDVRFVDVFPHAVDEDEAASATGVTGDGRQPESDFEGDLSFVSFTGPDVVEVWVTGDPAPGVSRDPENAFTDTTWCDVAGAAGTVQNPGNTGTGVCPIDNAAVSAIYAQMADVDVADTVSGTLELANDGHECDDIWTNSFGARHERTLLPIRSNDVSIMINCEFDLALTKEIDPAFTPGVDWLTVGSTTIDFLLEVTNQGDPIEDFDVTDYIDTSQFTFDAADNPAGTTGGDQALPYTWDATDAAAPVVSVDGAVPDDDVVTIPVTLVIEAVGGDLENWAEISYFDSDGDPDNGDSDPTNPNNPDTGALVDVDSTPDDDQNDDAQPTAAGAPGDDEVDGNGDGTDPVTGDEDDHDVAGIPTYDLELIKTPGSPTFDFSVTPPTVSYDLTVTNQGPTDVFWVDVTDYGATGLTYDAAATAAAWTTAGLAGVADANPTFTIEGPIASGASVIIPVVYEMDLSQAPFTNAAEISAFDTDADDSNAPSPFAVDIDSTPDATDDDDVIDHDQVNYDPDGDDNFSEPTPGDEDDHDIETLAPYDLALAKTFDSAVTPLYPDGSVTMLIEVTNQASAVALVDITDYIDATMWQPFDPALNPSDSVHANSTAALPFSFSWDATDPLNPVANVIGDTSGDLLAFGETIVVPITLKPVEGFAAVSPLSNTAEISNFDDDEDATNGNAFDGTLVDVDSTPDATNGNGPGEDPAADMVDDETSEDGTAGGDEDDHDGVLIPVYDLELIKTPGSPTYDFTTTPATITYALTVTNQGPTDVFWVDVTDYGAAGLTYDATATAAAWATAGLTGVTDANPTFTIEGPIAAGASVVLPVVYQITDYSVAPFTNAAEISAFDSDADNTNAADPLAFDVDSTPDATNDDDVEDHNNLNNDPDGDGNLNEATPGDEDDHDIETLAPYDLALAKTFDSADTPLLPDGSVTMLIEVTNQAAPVATIDITDYIDATMWLPFDAALNPDTAVHASSTAAAPFSFAWDATDPLNPVAAITADTSGDVIAFGETIVIPITLQPVPGFVSVAPLTNTAEISNFDSDDDPTNGDASDGTLTDLDSTPDATNGNGPGEDPAADMVDDDLDGDGNNGGDEDDHDSVSIPVYDLELIKTLATPAFDFTVSPPTATFEISVTNQGADPVWFVDVTDYGAPGLTYDPAATAAAWAAAGLTDVTDANPTFTIAGPVNPGETVTIPVVYGMDMSQAPFTNAAEISAFDSDDDPANPADPLAYDVDSTPDDTNDDDVEDHNNLNNDPDGDGNLNEATPGDEDDHDIETAAPYDLALAKTFDSMVTPLVPDGSVTMLIEVTNQAGPVATIDITDYIDPTMWDAFSATLNPDAAVHANSTAAAPFSFAWDATDPLNPVATVAADTSGDVLAFGETIVIPVTLEPLPNFQDAEPLANHAEISNFDSDDDPTNGDASDGTLVDLDSTPDATNGNGPGEDPAADMVDDAIDGDGTAGGDEDDHDIVLVPVYDLELVKTAGTPTFDFAASPATVTYDLTVTNQGYVDVYWVDVTDYGAAGLAYDQAATLAGWSAGGLSGLVEAAPVFTIKGPVAPGESVVIPVVYQITDYLEAPFTNSAEISKFDSDDDPVNPADPNAIDVDSTPDGLDDDEVIDHNEVNYDPDGNGDVNEATPGDEDDHDIETVYPFDLALAKSFVSADSPLLPDGSVTMMITVTNQLAPVATVDVTDYIDASMWRPFDAALNPNGAVDPSSTATGFSFTWDAADALNPVVTVTADTSGALIGFGETVAIPIVLQPAVGFDTSLPLVNLAEISNFDNDEDATNGDASDGTLLDADSTPDATNGNGPGEDPSDAMVDDEIGENSTTGGDEDDHDGVFIPVMDLALRKTVDPSTEFPISVGAPVTFLLEIINQGNVDVTNPTLVDYVDPAMWEAFDVALNPAGLMHSWAVNANGQDGDLAIAGTLAPGEVVSLPITLVIVAGADLEALSNTAEITGGTATVDDDGDPNTPPVELTNPDGSPVADIDSTPDATNDDPLSDDVTNGANGDEDDHDIAFVMPPTYDLGNQLWLDANNDGILDDDEAPIEGVTVELFSDADGDGLPDDTNGDGIIDSSDAIATTTTGPDGEYLFTDLAPGDYIVGIPPAMWDEDGPLYGTHPSNTASADPNDDVDNDNNGVAGPYGYTWSGPVTLDDTEPTGEPGLDNDPNHPDSLSNLTVDFGFHQPVFDLALEKTLAASQSSTVTVGDDVTYTITVTNQGDVTATDMEIVDYLPATMTLADADWTLDANGTATTTVAGPLDAGESTTVDITVTVTAAGTMDNHAEIASATPVDAGGAALTMPNGEPIPDSDSVFDDENGDTLTDGVTNEDGIGGGDEDDHDVATLTATAPAAPSPLAFSGAESRNLIMFALMLVGLGLLLLAATRRRSKLG